ncbi:MAG: DUF3429 domain-containing protein [Gammaproteobacteria bacterium]|nr:DUF3429 domain-containing protein [Gammaproteobacteria bacterium]
MTAVQLTADVWQRERRWLGFAGLLPFLVCVAAIYAGDALARTVAIDVLGSYAAVIASFLGAVHWGAAADDRDGLHHARLRWGVMPALIAWTLTMLPPPFAFAGFAVLFTLILVVDRYLLPVLDDRYREMRLHLSLIVIAALLLAAGGSS